MNKLIFFSLILFPFLFIFQHCKSGEEAPTLHPVDSNSISIDSLPEDVRGGTIIAIQDDVAKQREQDSLKQLQMAKYEAKTCNQLLEEYEAFLKTFSTTRNIKKLNEWTKNPKLGECYKTDKEARIKQDLLNTKYLGEDE